VYITGLFNRLQDEPIVRTGTIAAMPRVPIPGVKIGWREPCDSEGYFWSYHLSNRHPEKPELSTAHSHSTARSGDALRASRFWRKLRRRATHNRLFDTLADLKRSIRASLCYFQTLRHRVASLIDGCYPAAPTETPSANA
jgi:hypothetical protein